MAQMFVTYQPGGFATGNNFTSWNSMWTAILAAINTFGGGAQVTVDAQYNGDLAVVAAGSWNFEKVVLVGRRAPSGTAPTLVFPDGVTIPAACTRLRGSDLTLQTTRTTSPLWQPTAASALVQGDQLRLSAAGTQPVVAPAGAGLMVVLGPGASANNDGAAPIVLPALGGHVARFFLNADAEVRANSVAGPASAAVVVELAPNAMFALQPALLGTVSTTGPQQSGTTAQRPPHPYPGRLYWDTDLGRELAWSGSAWEAMGREVDVQAAQATADAAQLALASLDTGDVANASAAPGATATDALDALLADVGTRATASALAAETSARQAADLLLAPLASPSLSGNPTGPTAAPGDADASLATTAFVAAAVAAIPPPAPTSWGTIAGTLSSQADLQAALDLKAPLASPALTGTPTAPTAAALTSTTQLATTAFATGAVAAEAATRAAADALLAPLASPTFTGDPRVPTATPGDNDTTAASTAFVAAAVGVEAAARAAADALLAPLASPALTGNPTSTTPATSDNDTSIATTAMVQAVAALCVKAFNTGGAVSGARAWYGTATTDASGDWTANISAAGFSASPVVLVAAELNTTTVTDQVWATVRTRSATALAGTAIRGVVLAVLGATVRRAAAGATVHVLAIGT